MPKWSVGWLDNFKRRYGIKKHTKHGEAASVDTVNVKSQLETLYETLRPYSNRDITTWMRLRSTGRLYRTGPSLQFRWLAVK
jgi:hypothetical protein